ncbi:MAG: hypothetical protein UY07_C0035G0010 [Parcubacteria group bacterium GW2011_GWA1_47_8]|nr:MAG: hypothetical protein UY07_C0035G0010 [Parcubacteria group bacterium GW2011_GWA1_47_8]
MKGFTGKLSSWLPFKVTPIRVFTMAILIGMAWKIRSSNPEEGANLLLTLPKVGGVMIALVLVYLLVVLVMLWFGKKDRAEDITSSANTPLTEGASRKTPKSRVKRFIEWWKEWRKDKSEGRRFFLYIIVILLAYTAGMAAPEGRVLAYRGAVALIGAHVIGTILIAEKVSKFSWIVVLGMLAYFVLAWGYPNDVPRIFDASWGLSKKVTRSMADTIVSVHENYGKEKAPSVTALAEKPSAVKKILKKELALGPGTMEWVIRPPDAPQGANISISWKCPQGCFVMVNHAIALEESPLCINGKYKGYDCKAEVVEPMEPRNGNEFLAKETIVNAPGTQIQLPKMRDYQIGFSVPQGITLAKASYTLTY